MIRGTTPVLTFQLPIDVNAITVLSIAFSQNEKIVLEKRLDDCTIEGDTISVQLSERDTLQFTHRLKLEIQLRVGIGTKRITSNIIETTVGKILKDGVLE